MSLCCYSLFPDGLTPPWHRCPCGGGPVFPLTHHIHRQHRRCGCSSNAPLSLGRGTGEQDRLGSAGRVQESSLHSDPSVPRQQHPGRLGAQPHSGPAHRPMGRPVSPRATGAGSVGADGGDNSSEVRTAGRERETYFYYFVYSTITMLSMQSQHQSGPPG